MKKILYPGRRKGKGGKRARWEELLNQANELRHAAEKYGLPGLHRIADDKLAEMLRDELPRVIEGEPTATPCPICGKTAKRERPDLVVADATCTECGWFFTSSEARQARAGEP